MSMFTNCFSAARNWASDYIHFSWGALFISGLVSSKSFLQLAFQGFLILYLPDMWEMEGKDPPIQRAAILAHVFEVIVLFSSILAHHEAVDRIGHFWLIIITVPCLIIGLLMLWLFDLLLSSDWRNQLLLLYLALVLLTVGLAGQVALHPFLICQFSRQKADNNNNQVSEDLAEGRADFWLSAAGFLGTFTCWAFSSSLKDWNLTFRVTFIVVMVAYLLFCCGSGYYIREDPTKETAVLRMIQAKRLLKLIPLCLTFIPYSLVEASGDTFFIWQIYRPDSSGNIPDSIINLRIPIAPDSSINLRLPIASLYVFRTLMSSIMSMSSNCLIRKFWSSEKIMQHRAGFVRIAIGMSFAFGSSLSAWLVELRNPMKILWLAPQFGLLGIANGLAGKGMRNFFGDRLPKSMWLFVVPLTQGVMGIGRFISVIAILLARDWIGDTEDESHLDKYFRMLTILNITVMVVYIILSCMFDWNIKVASNETETPMEEADGRAVVTSLSELESDVVSVQGDGQETVHDDGSDSRAVGGEESHAQVLRRSFFWPKLLRRSTREKNRSTKLSSYV